MWPQNSLVNDLTPYLRKYDYLSGMVPIYVGISDPGSADTDAFWQVRKFAYDTNNNVLTVMFMNGSVRFDQIWANRVSLNGVSTTYK